MYEKNRKSCHLKAGQRKRSLIRRLTSCVHRPVGCKPRAKQIRNCGREISRKVVCSTMPKASERSSEIRTAKVSKQGEQEWDCRMMGTMAR